MVGGPVLELDLDALAPAFADQLRVHGGRGSAGVDVVDPLAAAVGRARVLDRVGMRLPEAVAEAEVEQLLAHRPRDRLGDLGPRADRRFGVVEARRLVEVAREEDRIAVGEQLLHRRERLLHRRSPHLVLARDHLLDRAAVLQHPRTPRDVVEVDVEERDRVSGLDLEHRV